MLLQSVTDTEARTLIDSGADLLLLVHSGEEKEVEVWEHLCSIQRVLPPCYELKAENIKAPETSSLFFVRYPRLLICSKGETEDISGFPDIWNWLSSRT